MSLFISRILYIIGSVILRIGKKLEPPPNDPEVLLKRGSLEEWRKAQGDEFLRLEYDLTRSSIVFDLGGYEGQWASDIYSKYTCTIHVFEPVSVFEDKISKRFQGNNKIISHNFGLGDSTKEITIGLNGTGSSIYKSCEELVAGRIICIEDFLKEYQVDRIDLMKINIEGGEYDLLEHMSSAGLITKVSNIQVQFHNIIPNARQRMENIQKELEKTHFPTYQYIWIWENWRIREDTL